MVQQSSHSRQLKKGANEGQSSVSFSVKDSPQTFYTSFLLTSS